MPLTDTAVPTTSFPADFAPTAGPAVDGIATLPPSRLPAELGARLERISRGRDESLQAVLAAAAVALLGRHTREDEVSLALPGGLVLRVDPAGTFRELLGRVAAAATHPAPRCRVPARPTSWWSSRSRPAGPARAAGGRGAVQRLPRGRWPGAERRL